MNYLKGFFVSLLLHGAAAGLLFAGQMNMTPAPSVPKTIDISAFTVAKAVEEAAPTAAPLPEVTPEPVKLKPVVKPKPISKPKPKTKPAEKPKPVVKPVFPPPVPVSEPVQESEPKYVSDFGDKEYAPVNVPVNPELPEYSGSGYVGGEEDAAEESGTETAGTGSGKGKGIGSGNIAEAYMQINLVGIRRKIHDSLEYPTVARRMGMRGTSAVKFRIHTDGKVDDASIHSSSGFKLLDEAARQAVLDASPLPSPSETVYVVLSVSFALR